VPLLGNIPLLGVLFRSKANETVREEVIVLLTPHIIGEPKEADGSDRSDDVVRKISGATNQLSSMNSIKLAQQHYEKAAINYVEGKNTEALNELKIALKLYPAYLEAIQLEEKISSEMDQAKKPVRKYIEEAEKEQTEKWRRK
jgi:Flp pilus assembly secretin CpaC